MVVRRRPAGKVPPGSPTPGPRATFRDPVSDQFVTSRADEIPILDEKQLAKALKSGTRAHKESQLAGFRNGTRKKAKELKARERSRANDKKKPSGRGRKI